MSTETLKTPSVTSEESRAFVLSSIAISTGLFSISFYYGVYGTVFFDHLFYVWVASSVALLASLFVPPVDALPAFISWRGRFVLILPTFFLAWLYFNNGATMNISTGGWIDWLLALAIMGLTLPYLIFVLVMVAVPDVERLTNPTLRMAILAIALLVVVSGYAIGRNHHHFVSCFDFEVSGNFVPKNCHHDPAHTGR